MMQIIKIIEGQPTVYSIDELKAENPLLQWPKEPPASLLAQYDVYNYVKAPEPAYNPITEQVVAGNITSEAEGFVQQWSVVALTGQEQADRLAEIRAATSVPRLAARLALIDADLWDSIPALLNAIPDATAKAKAQAYFEDAVNWRRLDDTVIAIGAGLGLSATEIDDLFTAAQAYV